MFTLFVLADHGHVQRHAQRPASDNLRRRKADRQRCHSSGLGDSSWFLDTSDGKQTIH